MLIFTPAPLSTATGFNLPQASALGTFVCRFFQPCGSPRQTLPSAFLFGTCLPHAFSP